MASAMASMAAREVRHGNRAIARPGIDEGCGRHLHHGDFAGTAVVPGPAELIAYPRHDEPPLQLKAGHSRSGTAIAQGG
jgi:hypothetical protein